jgi:hypothetical protein
MYRSIRNVNIITFLLPKSTTVLYVWCVLLIHLDDCNNWKMLLFYHCYWTCCNYNILYLVFVPILCLVTLIIIIQTILHKAFASCKSSVMLRYQPWTVSSYNLCSRQNNYWVDIQHIVNFIAMLTHL